MGVASFPLRLKETANITAKYEPESYEAPVEPCVGSPNEPVALPGWFCVYRGAILGGGERSFPGDKNAKFFKILKPNGEEVPPVGETGVLGALIAFRSDQFNEENIVKLTAETYLVAGGSWAVTEK
jgi:hypothetical protein